MELRPDGRDAAGRASSASFHSAPRLAARWPPAEKPSTAILSGSTRHSACRSRSSRTTSASSRRGRYPPARGPQEKQYFLSHGQTIYENPSPGNKKGGISTLEDKSLGCTQKSGSAPVSGVLSYGDTVLRRGLNLLSGPGNDLVASTALAAAGAHIVLFTTGRGTPFAAPVPTVNISSNSAPAERKQHWIDFNCGTLVERATVEELGQRLFDYVVEVASGRAVRAEEAGFRDMAIFKQGVTL